MHKYYSLEQWTQFANENPKSLPHVAASAGTSQSDFEKLSEILKAIPGITFICLDVANGYSQHFVEFVRKVRMAFPDHTIIVCVMWVLIIIITWLLLFKAGNVVTGEMVEELILSGADLIKVGIGPGSICTTRLKTGVGYPQLSAVLECADAAHGLGGHIISDGGCTCPGDVAKAFGAGADFVMAGAMFSGHDQCDGDIIEKNGKKFKLFYGMSSDTAMKKHAGKSYKATRSYKEKILWLTRYKKFICFLILQFGWLLYWFDPLKAFILGGVAEYRTSEGKTVEVPYKGDVEVTILDILGGLRSACTYTGAAKLKELSKRATFIRCTQQLNPIFS